ncbi:hypothetical protein SDC9_142830 [bioreactor metagenome]|uniref:Uncharacterized protein n=1 Tax=bioreactor metagenome TaxID=1076179 RepID=A0A645E2B7_9ZZZZ
MIVPEDKTCKKSLGRKIKKRRLERESLGYKASHNNFINTTAFHVLNSESYVRFCNVYHFK